MMVDHAEWLLFAWVFGNQAGVPLPVVPALLGAGVLAGSGYVSMAAIIGIAVGASLAADVTWYGLGRWRGARVLEILGRFAPSAGILVTRARHAFAAHGGAFQLGARFLPELNAIATGLAGATKVSITRFVCYGAVSALTWAGGWIGLGYVLSQAVTETAAHLGIRLIVFFLAAFALYLLFHRVRRHRLIRVFRQARVSPDDLETRVENGARESTPLLPPTHSSGKEDDQASRTVGAPFQSRGLGRVSDVPPDLIDMIGRGPQP
jgi:membrane protein DedA with SNARE-associated domain